MLSAKHYYPFGMVMPGRSYSSGTLYRYGFNGKENDNDVKGTANQQDYGMRIYDPRTARFYSVDPYYKRYPFYSSYQFAGNSPIAAVDIDGLEPAGRVANGGGGYMYKSMIDRGKYQTVVGGQQVNGTLYRVVDSKDINYWVVQETKVDFYKDTWVGWTTAIRKEYYYFTKPPSANPDDYEGGEWQHYDTENRMAFRQSNSVANGIAAGVAAGVTAPFTIPMAPEILTASASAGRYFWISFCKF